MVNRRLVFWSIVLCYAVSGCTKGLVTECTPPDMEQLAGSYVATTFHESGIIDQRVDILAQGGSLTVRLTADFQVAGRLVIPANIGSNYPPTDTVYTGTFTLHCDTVRLQHTGTSLDYYPGHPWEFVFTGDRLETPAWSGWWALDTIILEKQPDPQE